MKKWISDKLPLIKTKMKNEKVEALVAKILSFFMKFSYYTTYWTVVGKDIPNNYHKNNTPFLVSLWHDRLMTAPCVWHWKKPLHVLASNHRDGRLIAKVVKNFHMPAVFGSTGKGIEAVKKIIRLVRNGNYVAIIPDGPRGPRHKLAPGIITISRFTKVDILPFSCCVKRFYQFDSWDKFIIAWPFNKGAIVWGEPIHWEYLKTLSETDAIAYVENKINECSQKAYRLLVD